MPEGKGYKGVAAVSQKSDATDKQKYAAKLAPSANVASKGFQVQPNAVQKKAYKKDRPQTHKAQDTKFSGSLRKYSREYVGPTGGNLLDAHVGKSKFQRRFGQDGTVSRATPKGAIGMSGGFFPSREQSYKAGFSHHPEKRAIAS